MQFLDPLFNPTQTQAIAAARGIETDPVIDHRHVEPIVVAGHAHFDRAGLRVPDTIGQRLLDRSIDARPIAVRQDVEVAVHLQIFGGA